MLGARLDALLPSAGPAIEQAVTRGARQTVELVEVSRDLRVFALSVLNVMNEAISEGILVEAKFCDGNAELLE